jgi:hypothetical protein
MIFLVKHIYDVTKTKNQHLERDVLWKIYLKGPFKTFYRKIFYLFSSTAFGKACTLLQFNWSIGKQKDQWRNVLCVRNSYWHVCGTLPRIHFSANILIYLIICYNILPDIYAHNIISRKIMFLKECDIALTRFIFIVNTYDFGLILKGPFKTFYRKISYLFSSTAFGKSCTLLLQFKWSIGKQKDLWRNVLWVRNSC